MYNVNFYSHHVQDDETALHFAAAYGQTEVVKYLVENTTAEVNAKNRVSHLFVLMIMIIVQSNTTINCGVKVCRSY